MRLVLFLSIFAVCIQLNAQQTTSGTTTTTPETASDPQAVAVVQAAITAIGGATAIAPLQSWTFQGQAVGRTGTMNGNLALTVPQNAAQPSGTTAKAPPPWARPRSLFVPALVSAILANESQDPNFVLKQGATSPSAPNATVVAFLLNTKSGGSALAQRWYFDKTSGLPNRIDFLLPPKIGLVEGFPGIVILSNYQNVGSILYPFQIVTFLQRQHAMETITLQSVTPSTATASTASTASASNSVSGGAQ